MGRPHRSGITKDALLSGMFGERPALLHPHHGPPGPGWQRRSCTYHPAIAPGPVQFRYAST